MTKDEREIDGAAMTNKPPKLIEREEIERARTVPLPGGVVLTDEEFQLRARMPLGSREPVVARSILTKVRNASTGEGA